MSDVRTLYLISAEKSGEGFWKIGNSKHQDPLKEDKKHFLECFRKELVGISAAKELEKALFDQQFKTYRYGFQYMRSALMSQSSFNKEDLRQEMIKNLIEIAHAFCDAGMVFITAIHHLKEMEYQVIKKMLAPFDSRVLSIGKNMTFSDINEKENNLSTETLSNLIELLKK